MSRSGLTSDAPRGYVGWAEGGNTRPMTLISNTKHVPTGVHSEDRICHVPRVVRFVVWLPTFFYGLGLRERGIRRSDEQESDREA